MKINSRALFFLLVTLLILTFGNTVTALNAKAQYQFTTPVLVVNSSFLNVRIGPGVQYEILLTVVGGTELPVLGVAKDRVWYQVSTVVGVGWVNQEFTIPRGNFSNTPVIDTSALVIETILAASPNTIGLPNGQGGGGSSSSATLPLGGTFVAGVDAKNRPIIINGPNERFRASLAVPAVQLRTSPGDNSPALGTLYRDDSIDFPIVNEGRDSQNIQWLAVVTPELGTGWIDAPKLRLRLSGAFRTVMVVTADTIAMGDGPGTGSATLPVITRGTEGFLVDISQDTQFIQIELGGGERGWIPFRSAEGRTGTPTDGLNLNPGSISATSGSEIVSGRPSNILSVPRVIINTAYLNVRSGPGAQYTPVATLSGGTELPVIGIAKDRVWYLVEGTFGQGWLNSEFTIFRGVMNNVPVVNTDVIVGDLAKPVAIVSAPTVLYVAPGTNFGVIGTISPAEFTIMARSSDNTWVQLSTSLGFGWVLSSQVILRGDLSTVPVVR
jgi:uncharacterized protein YgiM (DUF1202 family)